MTCLSRLQMIFIKSSPGGKYRADEFFYRIGKIVWLPFCLIGIWFSHGGYDSLKGWMMCAIREKCGLPCPGCGITRAFYYLFQGNLWESFRLNPTVIFGVLAYLHFMSVYFYRSHVSGTIRGREIRIPFYAYTAVTVMLIQWAVKIVNIFYLASERMW